MCGGMTLSEIAKVKPGGQGLDHLPGRIPREVYGVPFAEYAPELLIPPQSGLGRPELARLAVPLPVPKKNGRPGPPVQDDLVQFLDHQYPVFFIGDRYLVNRFGHDSSPGLKYARPFLERNQIENQEKTRLLSLKPKDREARAGSSLALDRRVNNPSKGLPG